MNSHVGDRGADSRGPVEDSFDLDRRWNTRCQLRQLRLDLIDGVDNIRAGLFHYRQDHAILVVLIRRNIAVLRLDHRAADVPDADRSAVAIGQNHVVEFICIA